MKILVSSCLLGEKCKWNGFSNYNEAIEIIKNNFECIPVCAEVLAGLPTPRIPSEIVGEKVYNQIGLDMTERFKEGAHKVLEIALKNDIKVALLKNGSPSCGSTLIYNGKFERVKIPGKGITTRLLEENDIKVYNEDQIEEFLNLYLK